MEQNTKFSIILFTFFVISCLALYMERDYTINEMAVVTRELVNKTNTFWDAQYVRTLGAICKRQVPTFSTLVGYNLSNETYLFFECTTTNQSLDVVFWLFYNGTVQYEMVQKNNTLFNNLVSVSGV